MEKQQQQEQFSKSPSAAYSNNKLWDCGSALYDSFELNSFKRQLDSAIANSPRTFSMSRLPEPRIQPELSLQPPSRKPFKISRSLNRFLRSVFKSSNNSKSNTGTSSFQVPENYTKDGFYMLYDKSGSVLSTISEVPETEIGAALPPEMSSFVGRSVSERFTGTTAINIACA